MTYTRLLRWFLVVALGLVGSAHAWPDKPVTVVVPFPPGGSTDLIARTLAPKLQEKFGGSFIVDNKAGATGTIGTGFVARAPADGHTLLVSSLGPFVIAPHLLSKVPYDALKDLDPISVAVQAPNVLVVPANSPHKTMAQVLAFAKANPDKMTFASSGNGSSDHLTAELFWLQTGTTGVHVPYKGGGPVMTDLLGGHEPQHCHASNLGGQVARAVHHECQALATAAVCAHAGRTGHQRRQCVFVASHCRPARSACRPQGQAACGHLGRLERPAGQTQIARTRF